MHKEIQEYLPQRCCKNKECPPLGLTSKLQCTILYDPQHVSSREHNAEREQTPVKMHIIHVT